MFHVKLQELVQKAGLTLRDEEIALLERHLDFVLEHNAEACLTALTNRSKAERLHILDSLLILPELNDAIVGPFLDLGTGGGYPGIPLAVASGRSATLLDSSRKKARLLTRYVSRETMLVDRVEISGLRAEELAVQRRNHYAVIVARAVATLPALLELACPLLMTGGHFLAMKGPRKGDEIERGMQAARQLGFSLISERAYTVPGGNEQRRLLVYEKETETELSLPRRVGRAQSRPLT
jgi:16S rRNA (guanine527-N7)-methyltransferase